MRVRRKGESGAGRVPSQPLIVLSGRRSVLLYDCKKILSCEREKISLLCGREIVTLVGAGLFCRSFTSGTLRVEGDLFSLRFGEERSS